MSCPTCDHTMARLCVTDTGVRVFLCPRCGTVKTEGEGVDWVLVPKLVDRCREFEHEALDNGFDSTKQASLWVRLGITESIHPPLARPPI